MDAQPDVARIFMEIVMDAHLLILRLTTSDGWDGRTST